jgi:hypothetical protein
MTVLYIEYFEDWTHASTQGLDPRRSFETTSMRDQRMCSNQQLVEKT